MSTAPEETAGTEGTASAGPELVLPDVDTLADLQTYLARAKRADPDGAVRLSAHGDVLAAYVSPVHGPRGPVVIGLRVLRLARPSDLDVVVALAGMADRFARLTSTGVLDPGALGSAGNSAGNSAENGGAGPIRLSVPAAQATGVAWAGTLPPRAGWAPVGAVPAAGLDVVEGLPEGAAHAARILGFLPRAAGADGPDQPDGPEQPGGVDGAEGGEVVVHRCGPWWRLTTPAGYVLARSAPALLG